MAQTAPLSLALAILSPVLILPCVLLRSALVMFRFCSAIIALTFVLTELAMGRSFHSGGVVRTSAGGRFFAHARPSKSQARINHARTASECCFYCYFRIS